MYYRQAILVRAIIGASHSINYAVPCSDCSGQHRKLAGRMGGARGMERNLGNLGTDDEYWIWHQHWRCAPLGLGQSTSLVYV